MLIEIPFPQIHPAAFTIPFPSFSLGPLTFGPLPLRWYALAYIAGITLGWWYANRIAAKPKLWGDESRSPVSSTDISDFAFWVMIGVMLGGRVGYILFYTLPFEPEKFVRDPTFVLRLWEGGMSFHGGLAGAAVALAYTAWSRRISLLSLGDVACAAAPIGICLVRLANFVNGELYGHPTTLPWAVRFPTFNWATDTWVFRGDEKLVHPSQLYEAALEGIALFVVLAIAVWVFRALRRPGLISGIFLAGYACARVFAEQFRQPDSFVSGLPAFLTMGMLLSAPMILIGAFLMVRAMRRPVLVQTALGDT